MTKNDNLRGLLMRIIEELRTDKDLTLFQWRQRRADQLEAELAALAEPDSNDTRRVNDYDARAFALGYPNVILALAELERLKAEPDSGEVENDPLTEALEHIRDSIEMQVELINIRAPGKYLDKQPIVSALLSHRRRCIKALELNKAPGKAEPGVSE